MNVGFYHDFGSHVLLDLLGSGMKGTFSSWFSILLAMALLSPSGMRVYAADNASALLLPRNCFRPKTRIDPDFRSTRCGNCHTGEAVVGR